MTEQERSNLLMAYAAGALEGPAVEVIRARLAAGDPDLTGKLAEAEVVLARLAGTASPVAPPPALKKRILDALPDKPRARAAGDEGSTTAYATAAIRKSSTRPVAAPWLSRFAAAAAVAAVLVGGGLLYVGWQDRQARIARLEAELGDRTARGGDLQGTLGSADATFAVLGPAAGDAKQEFGRVLVDPATRQVRVFVYRLVPPPPGKVYQLWLLPEGGGGPVPAPTFTVDADNKAVLTAAIPAGVKGVVGAAVSEEPPGGSKTTPTTVRLISKAI